MRGSTRLNAADKENQQFHSFYETKIFNFALKKVPKRVESRAWARSVTFLKRNIRNRSQSRDLTYEGDAISVVIILSMSCLNVDTGYDTHIYGFFPWGDRESRLFGYNVRKHDRKCD